MTEEDLFAFYTGDFQTIYADLVAVVRTKPTQVLIEIENAFSHLATARTHPEVRDDNISKAMGHLRRAALDSSKILWLEYGSKVRTFAEDDEIRAFCVNCSEDRFSQLLLQADKLAKEARRHELKNVGVAPEEAVQKYYAAAQAMENALEVCDFTNLRRYKKTRIFYRAKEYIIGFALGVLASLLANHL